jgi:hemoglobin/transferrin/lactoferrin receptor protein
MVGLALGFVSIACEAADFRSEASLGAGPVATVDSVVLKLPEVVVTGTRSPQPLRSYPGTARIVGRDELLVLLPSSAASALRGIPGIMVQKTSPGQASPFLRGFTGFRNVYLIDGVRLNNSVFREGPNQYWNQIDLYGVDRFEVVLGPGAVGYGSDAVGGVVQAVGRQAWPGDGSRWNGMLLLRAATAEQSQTGRFEAGYSDPRRGGILAGVTLRDMGTLRAGRGVGEQPYTGYEDAAYDVRVELPSGWGRRVVLVHQDYQQDDVPRTHSTVYAKSFAGTSVGTDQRRELDQRRRLTYLQVRPAGASESDGIEAGVSYQQMIEREDRIDRKGVKTNQGFDVGTMGGFAEAHLGTRFGRWSGGVDAYQDDVDSYSNSNPIQGPVADDARYTTIGAFVLHEARPLAGVKVLSGGRYTHARAVAGAVRDPLTGQRVSIDDQWNSLIGSVRCGVFPGEGSSGAYAGLSQAFRAPNLSDLTRFDIARTKEIEIPAPGLDPERYVSAEVGLRFAAGSLQAGWAGYRTWIDGMIVRRPTGRIVNGNTEVTRANAGDGYVNGMEAFAEWRPDRGWALRGQVSWQLGEADQFPTSAPLLVREPLSRVMPLTGSVAVAWRAPHLPVTTELEVVAASRQHRLSTEDRRDTSRIPPEGTPGYVIGNLRSAWRPGALGLVLTVENLADEDYRVHGSGSNEAGRNFVLGLEMRF